MPEMLPDADPYHMTSMSPEDNSSDPEVSDMKGMVPSMNRLNTAVTTGIGHPQAGGYLKARENNAKSHVAGRQEQRNGRNRTLLAPIYS
ncbi:TPA: hypothetical protein ACH3X2_002642 [Trebouxia sp. C0005]